MAVVADHVLRNRLFRAVRGVPRAGIILTLVIMTGVALTVWSRAQIEALLRIDQGAILEMEVSGIVGECGTPSLYVLPEADGDRTRLRMLVDVLGGGYRNPMFNAEATDAVLALPSTRRPGIGLGRGLPDGCERLTLAISGEGVAFGGATRADRSYGDRSGASVRPDGSGRILVDYVKPAQPGDRAAIADFSVNEVADRWQHGSKRIAFRNVGPRDVNVFMHEEAGYQFVNEQDALVRPIGVRLAYVDVNLAPPGSDADNTVVVYRRRPTSDIELQHDLIGISTVFGIGVSLLIEGVLVLVISLSGTRRISGPGSEA